MIKLKLKVLGKKQINYNIDRLRGRVRVGTRSALWRAMEILKVNADENLRGDLKGTGATRPIDSIFERWFKERPKTEGNVISATLYNYSPHAQAVEFGTLNAKIVPKHAEALKFMYGDRLVYAKEVKGQPPKAFLRKAMNMSKDMLATDMQRQIKARLMARFGG